MAKCKALTGSAVKELTNISEFYNQQLQKALSVQVGSVLKITLFQTIQSCD